jgi:hypothetical protein
MARRPRTLKPVEGPTAGKHFRLEPETLAQLDAVKKHLQDSQDGTTFPKKISRADAIRYCAKVTYDQIK